MESYNRQQVIINRTDRLSQRWRHHWPTKLIGALASCQLIITLIVIGLEGTIIALDIVDSDSFSFQTFPNRLNYNFGRYGLAAIVFYTFAWISTYTVVCCNRDSFYCAIHALFENFAAFILSCLLIHYDNYQINEYYVVLWGTFANADLIQVLLKVQLAMAVLMLVSNLAFAALFVWVCIKVFWLNRTTIKPNAQVPYLGGNPIQPVYQLGPLGPMPSGQIPNSSNNWSLPPPNTNQQGAMGKGACPTCGHVVPT